MKRSFLKELNLESEVIDKIMAENGKDIERYKSEIEDYISEIKDLKANNSDTDKAIRDAVKAKEEELREEFKSKETELNEALKKAENYDNLAKELEDLKQSNIDRDYTQSIEKFFEENKIGFTSSFAKDGILEKFKEQKFETKDGKFGKDASKFMKDLQESNKDAFKVAETTQDPKKSTNTYHYEPGGGQNTGEAEMQAQVNSILGI